MGIGKEYLWRERERAYACELTPDCRERCAAAEPRPCWKEAAATVDKIRLRFTKTGKAAYISHLDLMRTVQRALNRGGVPIRYSEGFNPHALLSILLPLPVGVESFCELMDIRVREELDLKALPALLTKYMPGGSVSREPGRAGSRVRASNGCACAAFWRTTAERTAPAPPRCGVSSSGRASPFCGGQRAGRANLT
jgi:hypothetical protein